MASCCAFNFPFFGCSTQLACHSMYNPESPACAAAIINKKKSQAGCPCADGRINSSWVISPRRVKSHLLVYHWSGTPYHKTLAGPLGSFTVVIRAAGSSLGIQSSHHCTTATCAILHTFSQMGLAFPCNTAIISSFQPHRDPLFGFLTPLL